MWKCTCGSVQHSIAQPCLCCGRTFGQIQRTIKERKVIELAGSLTKGPKMEVNGIQHKAYLLLEEGYELGGIVEQIENMGATAQSLAHIIRQLLV